MIFEVSDYPLHITSAVPREVKMFTEETEAHIINHGSRMPLRHPNADARCAVRSV